MPAVVCIVGPSGSGKTTLIESLVPELAARGLSVGTIKHASHGFEMDREGKDTWRHRRAGAVATLIVAEGKLAVQSDLIQEPSLGALVARYLDDVDLVLVEGFKKEDSTRVEVFRRGCGLEDLLTSRETGLLAIVTDDPGIGEGAGVPVFAPDEARRLARHILRRLDVPAPGATASSSARKSETLDLEFRLDQPPFPRTRWGTLDLIGRTLGAVLSALAGSVRGGTGGGGRWP